MLEDVITMSAAKADLTSARQHFSEARYRIVQVQQHLTDVSATGNQAGVAEAEKHYLAAKENLNSATAYLKQYDLIGTEEYVQLIDRLDPKIMALVLLGKRMAMTYLDQGQEAGNEIMTGAGGFDEAVEKLETEFMVLSAFINEELKLSGQYLKQHQQTTKAFILLFTLATTTGTFLLFFLIYKMTIGPLVRLQRSLTAFSEGNGDLTQRLPDAGQNEIGAVVLEFNKFVASLQTLIRNVNTEVAQVTDSAQMMLSVAKDTAVGVHKQQGETDQIATAINEMSATVQEVVNNTAHASTAAQEADQAAHQGLGLVKSMMSATSHLANEVQQTSQVINELGTHSENIGAVVDVIRGVAEQTNLLALNAAIEAARAGEQGRGFAVVADEVRSLASRTQQSTAEIQALIEQLQAEAHNAVEVMDKGCQDAKETEALGLTAGEALELITRTVSNIKEMNMQIATAAEEQSCVTEEVNQNVVRIVDVAESTSQGAQKNEESCQELLKMAQELNQRLSGFRV